MKEFCKSKKIKIIEDCAQSFGAINNGEPNGKFADLACYSMNPMKVFGGFGDAGAVCFNSSLIYKKIKSLRYAGTVNKEIVVDADLNHKIDSLQAMILLEQLKLLKKKLKKEYQMPFFTKNDSRIKFVSRNFFQIVVMYIIHIQF